MQKSAVKIEQCRDYFYGKEKQVTNSVREKDGPLKVRTHRIILGTERFKECVHFYRDVLDLPVWFEKDHLVCLRFGDGYLMIETGGVACIGRKPNQENPTMLRFNVEDVESAATELEARGVFVEIKRFSWGTVRTFTDPDGKCLRTEERRRSIFA